MHEHLSFDYALNLIILLSKLTNHKVEVFLSKYRINIDFGKVIVGYKEYPYK